MKKSFAITALMVLAINANAKKLPVNITPYVGISYGQTKISTNDIKNADILSLFNEDTKGFVTNDIVVNSGIDIMYEKNIDKHKISVGGGLSFSYSKSLGNTLSKELKKQPDKLLLLEEEANIRKAEEELLNLFKEGNKSLVEARSVGKMIKVLNLEIQANEGKLKRAESKLSEFKEIKKKYPTEEKVEELKAKVDEINKKVEDNRAKVSELFKKRSEFIKAHPEIEPDKLRENEEYSKIQDEYLAAVKESDNGFIELLNITIDYTTAKNVDKYIKDKEEEYLTSYSKLKVLYKVKDSMNKELAKHYTPDNYEESEDEEESENETTLEEDKEKIYEFDFEDTLDELMEKVEEYYTKYEEVNELSNEYVVKQLMAEKNNKNAKEVLEKSVNNMQKITGSAYLKAEYAYSLKDDLELFTDFKAGLNVSNNPVYMIARTLETENVKIDGKDYITPISVKKVKYDGLFNIGAGIRYRNFGVRVNAGYGEKIFGVDLSYRF